jgi:murein DD-endopeptidase MepM/ murein hydrolase activator NlpD
MKLSIIGSIFCAIILFFSTWAYALVYEGRTCVNTLVTSSDGYQWHDQICWDVWVGTPSIELSESDPYYEEGNSSPTETNIYAGNDLDSNADSTLDCFKDVTHSGDYNLSSNKDFGPGSTGNHNGIDISAAKGTPIFSPGYMKLSYVQPNGEENTSGQLKGNGAYIRGVLYRSGQEYEIVLIHMEDQSATVTKNQVVYPGEYLGNVNNTGGSHGNHLHMSVYGISYAEGEFSPGEKVPDLDRIKTPIDPVTFMGGSACSKQGVYQ